ncbi:hypothetical protein ICW40_02180 [Actinotalea ferrariae]|uniref:hypothetical protein n=1 Tax=Actinotalea ferrariae TaxID=1386098 RepID=UPI001C8B6672|nr:hypothetical protein [Actinotalea ferrariae]MBX9243610.1 hypothetical protein [Actinotalea ferrariae]
MQQALEILGALTPSVGVGLIFWLAMRKIIHADRNERAAQAALDRYHQAGPGHEPDAGRRASVYGERRQPDGTRDIDMRAGSAAAPTAQVSASPARSGSTLSDGHASEGSDD